MLRTFRRRDFFWSIDRQGTTATVRHGKAGGKVKDAVDSVKDKLTGKD